MVKGNFIVKAKVGDEIRVSHPDFETVYYTIKSNEEIKVIVKNFTSKIKSKFSKNSTRNKASWKPDLYHQFLDSAKFHKKKELWC